MICLLSLTSILLLSATMWASENALFKSSPVKHARFNANTEYETHTLEHEQMRMDYHHSLNMLCDNQPFSREKKVFKSYWIHYLGVSIKNLKQTKTLAAYQRNYEVWRQCIEYLSGSFELLNNGFKDKPHQRELFFNYINQLIVEKCSTKDLAWALEIETDIVRLPPLTSDIGLE